MHRDKNEFRGFSKGERREEKAKGLIIHQREFQVTLIYLLTDR